METPSNLNFQRHTKPVFKHIKVNNKIVLVLYITLLPRLTNDKNEFHNFSLKQNTHDSQINGSNLLEAFTRFYLELLLHHLDLKSQIHQPLTLINSNSNILVFK